MTGKDAKKGSAKGVRRELPCGVIVRRKEKTYIGGAKIELRVEKRGRKKDHRNGRKLGGRLDGKEKDVLGKSKPNNFWGGGGERQDEEIGRMTRLLLLRGKQKKDLRKYLGDEEKAEGR